MSEKFSLKWNDFHSNAAKAFSFFRNDDYLHDVTLVSDDHKQISAHKLVLSAGSEYFNNIFKQNRHSHPLLCLQGVTSEDMNNILDYMYNGEVQIYQDNLDRFLTVAQRLELNGLIGNDQNEKYFEEKTNHVEQYVNKNEKWNSDHPHQEQEPQSVAKVENENVTTISLNEEEINNVKEKVNEFLEKSSDGSYSCKLCGKMSSIKKDRNAPQNMRNHIETHLEGLSFSCSHCQKSFRSKHAYLNHKYRYHKS